ncbi:hypothetical protein [Maridesulfovibrio sp.]|uniref:hypothetical protein n=1 Tax=Maridesulfovibrio sp. TaxID=2795000 RepID=UPI0039EE284B
MDLSFPLRKEHEWKCIMHCLFAYKTGKTLEVRAEISGVWIKGLGRKINVQDVT